MTHKRPPLPYALDALKGFVSEEQMNFHYNKHHEAYFAKLNPLIKDKPEEKLALRDLVIQSQGGVFNNAAQAWNHSFFWECMTPSGKETPKGPLADAIERDFGSFQAFKEKFSQAALTLFGSGWAWLAKDATGKLEIMSLGNADTPLKHGKDAVITLDVWEHAYYIDYRNERNRFIEGFWEVANWEFANKCFTKGTVGF